MLPKPIKPTRPGTITPPFGPTSPGDTGALPAPGTPGWEAAVRQLIYAGLSEYYLYNNEVPWASAGAGLDIYQQQDPQAFDKIYKEVDAQVKATYLEQETARQEALAAAAGAGGGGSTRYIDVPTPEEFLDDFRTAFLGNLQNYVKSGTLNVGELEWAQNNWDIFANEYVGSLAQKAQKGEDIFKVVGVGGAETQLGTEGAGAGETEPVITRPGVAVVHALSPTDWLNQTYPEKKLNLFIAGHIPSVQPKGGAGVGAYGRPRGVY